MTRYDKIYVPMEFSPHIRLQYRRDGLHQWEIGTNLQREDDVIVLTVEELEKVWNAGWRAKVLENHPTAINKDFKTYLQSKGINIEC